MLSTRRVLAALVLTAAAMGVLNLAPGLPHGDLHWATARAHLRAETGALWVPPACCCLYMLAAPTRLPSHAHAVVGGCRTAGQLLGRWQGSPLRWHLRQAIAGLARWRTLTAVPAHRQPTASSYPWG